MKDHAKHNLYINEVVPVEIKSEALSLHLDIVKALPVEYDLPQMKEGFKGYLQDKELEVTVCRLSPREYRTVRAETVSYSIEGTCADFRLQTYFDNMPASSFTLRYEIADASLSISLEDVSEYPGYELIEIRMPSIISICQEDRNAWMAHGNQGGNLVYLKDAKPGSLPTDSFFGKTLFTLPVILMGTDKAAFSFEGQSFMDGMELSVEGGNGTIRGIAGTIKTWRVHGGRSYNLNDGKPFNDGNENTPNMLCGQKSICRLDFTGDYDGSGRIDWLDAAKLVRDRMPKIPTHYYDDKLLYLIGCDNPTFEKPRTTFSQCESLIRDIYMLTDGNPQIAYLAGFQYDGHDTGYPAVDKVNERLGGHDGLMTLMTNAEKCKAIVSLDDNYDDAYDTSPQWDESIIARRPDGEIWQSRRWSRDMSYIIGLAKYMRKNAKERVRFTCDYYKLKETTLIDVLSWFAIRNDWDPENPASGFTNFVEGRCALFDEFSRYGINVVSEQLRYPWIGKMALSVDGVRGEKCPFGGKAIPMLPLILRHSVIYGGQISDEPVQDICSNLFYNARPGPWFGFETPRESITDFFYLQVLPWMRLHDLDIMAFLRYGEKTLITLEENSSIETDWSSMYHRVVYHGAEIMCDLSITCPMDENRVAFYSKREKDLQYRLPKGTDIHSIKIEALYADRREEVPYMIEDGSIHIHVSAQRPVIAYIGQK